MVFFGNRWDDILQADLESENYRLLREYLKEEYAQGPVYPPKEDIFNALKYTDYDDVKVVLLGQDPYHGPGQAHGFAFSVQRGVKIPPSLQNMYKELQTDLGCTIPSHGNLLEWANQGVLMLNTVLTVREGQPNSHKNRGWELITDSIIRHLDKREKPLVFLLWGANARNKIPLIHACSIWCWQRPTPVPFRPGRAFSAVSIFPRQMTFWLPAGSVPSTGRSTNKEERPC